MFGVRIMLSVLIEVGVFLNFIFLLFVSMKEAPIYWPQQKLTENKKKIPNVALLFTWGTFLSSDSKEWRVVEKESTNSNIKKTKNVLSEYSYDEFNFLNIDSSDLTPQNRELLVKNIKKLEESDPDKYSWYVIIHGTDTMEYSASALSYMLKGLKKPVVLTGSMLSIEDMNSDAPANITRAFMAATNDLLKWVFVSFDKNLLQWTKVRKTDTNKFDTFQTPDFPNVGIFEDIWNWEEAITLNKNMTEKIADMVEATELDIFDQLEENVAVIKLTPGFNLDLFDAFVREWIKGIVLEGYGDGNVLSFQEDLYQKYKETHGDNINTYDQNIVRGKLFQEKIQMCIDSGMVIVLKSQCNTGVADHKYLWAQQTLQKGAVSGGNMTTPAAFTKLMRALARSKWNTQRAKELITTNIAWELNKKQ